MVSTFNNIQLDIKLQMEKHEQHIQTTSNKFELVDKRTDVDIEGLIADLKLQADDMGQRLYNVQMEQIKPLKEQNASMEAEIQIMKEQLEEIGFGAD